MLVLADLVLADLVLADLVLADLVLADLVLAENDDCYLMRQPRPGLATLASP